MRKSQHTVFAALVSGLAAALISLSVHALPFSNLFAFGDSLSDAGNAALAIDAGLTPFPPFTREPTPFPAGHSLVPDFPYAEGNGRLSNGPVWVEQLAATLGLSAAPSLAGGTNGAFGGARTGPSGAPPVPPLVDQVAGFLFSTGGVAPSDALYTVWGGANDVRDALDQGDINVAIAAANNIAALVGDLAAAGAVHILVPNLPDLGVTPALMRLDLIAPGTAAAGNFFSTTFNATLAAALAPLIVNPTLRIVPLDIFSLVNDVVAAPGAFGLNNAMDPCVDIGTLCGNPQDYLFWDGIHPTTRAHGIIARAALNAIPEPGTVLLVTLGAMLVAASRRRSA